jgi:transmembrane sensor
MIDNAEKASAAIAEQAGEWFVSNDTGPLSAHDSEALAEWLKTSPVHVEEFLSVSLIARDLRDLHADPGYSLDAMREQSRSGEDTVSRLAQRVAEPITSTFSGRWQIAAAAVAGCTVLSLGLLYRGGQKPVLDAAAPSEVAAMHFHAGHAEQLTRRLADNSILHLNTDSAVTIQYSHTERFVTLLSGEASFEVSHESDRPFRVFAGSAQVVDVGTSFDVRLEPDVATITVLEGRVIVGQSNESQPTQFVELKADQQVRVTAGKWPPTSVAIDAQRVTAWLHRQIAFDHEPLDRVAAEYNRYARKPINIITPALRNLRITGVFATDNPDEFVAFLRSLRGVHIEITDTQVRVSGD